MSLEDRIVTTAALRAFAQETSGTLAIPGGLLCRLPDGGMHVLVPRCPAPVPGEVLMCEVQLDTGGATPTCVPVLVPQSVWCRLPTAFTVVAAATRLVPAAVEAAVAAIGSQSPPDDNGLTTGGLVGEGF